MTIYYVRADGSAANFAAATGPTTDATKCVNMSKANAASGLSAGSTLLFSDKGGDYTTQLKPAHAGPASITYKNAPGETPVIDVAADHCIRDGFGAGGSWSQAGLTFDGFTLKAHGTNQPFHVGNGTTNLTVKNITATRDGTGATFQADNGAQNGLVLDTIDTTGGTGYAVYLVTTDAVVNTGVTLRNLTGRGGLNMTKVAGLTMTGIALSGGGAGGALTAGAFTTITGVLTITNVSFANFNTSGVTWTLCTFGAGSSSAFFVVSSCGGGIMFAGCVGNGMRLFNTRAVLNGGNGISLWRSGTTMSSGFTFDGGEIGNNLLDGFDVGTDTDDTSNTIDLGRFWIHGNGRFVATNGVLTDGDGVTAHSGCHTITVHDCLIEDNIASGFTVVDQSSGSITNCTVRNNGKNNGTLFASRANIAIGTDEGSAGWRMYNTICYGGYPYEMAWSAAQDSWCIPPYWNYNRYYALDKNQFVKVSTNAPISWDTWISEESTEGPQSQHGPIDIDANGIPLRGGNCDVGRGSFALSGKTVGSLDRLGRPWLSTLAPIGDEYPQRIDPRNVILPVVQLPPECE